MAANSRSTSTASGIPVASAGDPQPARRLGHRPVLDGLRGIAVLLVLAVHVGLLDSGDIGVDLFLPLSGFLITALLYEEWERHGALSLRRFYARRARRLLPALTMLVVVVFAVLSLLLVDTFRVTLPKGTLAGSTLLFANNWVATLSTAHGRALGPLSPTWSLAQEGQFYLLWPAVLALLLRWRSRTSFVLGVVGLSILVLVAAVPFVRHAYPAYGAYTSPLDRSAELLLGCAAAILWRERLLPPPLGRPITAWLAFAGLAFVVAQAKTPQPTTYLAAAVLTTLLIVSLLTGGQIGSDSDRPSRRLAGRAGGMLSAGLSSRPLRFTGKISYGVYLYDLPIYYLVELRARPVPVPLRRGCSRFQSSRGRRFMEMVRVSDHSRHRTRRACPCPRQPRSLRPSPQRADRPRALARTRSARRDRSSSPRAACSSPVARITG